MNMYGLVYCTIHLLVFPQVRLWRIMYLPHSWLVVRGVVQQTRRTGTRLRNHNGEDKERKVPSSRGCAKRRIAFATNSFELCPDEHLRRRGVETSYGRVIRFVQF